MKTLIVFYSLTGNTEKIAQAIAEATAGEMLEIRLKKDLPAKGFMRFFWAGAQLVKKELPELLPMGIDLGNYDLMFLGTPVWGGNTVPPVRSFLLGAELRNKKIALFCAHGGDDPGQAFVSLEKELAGNKIVGKIDFKMDGITESQVTDNLRKAGEWAKNIAGE